MIKLILLISLLIVIIPAYIFIGREIIQFIYDSYKSLSNFDFKKRFWIILKNLLSVVWLPLLYVIIHIALIAWILYRSYVFYTGAKSDILFSWYQIRNDLLTNNKENEDYE